jgi:hypothetical protein
MIDGEAAGRGQKLLRSIDAEVLRKLCEIPHHMIFAASQGGFGIR